jgi:hypothetical protein
VNSSITWTITERPGSETTVSVFADSFEKTIPASHTSYRDVVTYLAETSDRPEERDEETLRRLTDPLLVVRDRVARITDRVTFDDNLSTLRYDGVPINSALARRIKERLRAGDTGSLKPLLRFLVNLEENPSSRAKEATYGWVERHGLTVTKDGSFLGYKAVQEDGSSKSAGPNNFVNGELYLDGEHTRVPHEVGSVISKRRADVDDTPGGGCSTGLHVGTLQYATGFAPRLMIVKVNPRDVVSASDSDLEWKIRVCEYRVESLATPGVLEDGVFHTRADRHAALARLDAEQRATYDGLRREGKGHVEALHEATNPVHPVINEASPWAPIPDGNEADVDPQEHPLDDEEPDHNEDDVEAPEEPSADLTLAENAALVADLKRDLHDGSIGHKPLARKWSHLTTEASVRRYRKANGVSRTVGTALRDAVS